MEPSDFLDLELDRFMGADALAAERTPQGFAEHLRSALRDRRLVGAGMDRADLLLFFGNQTEPERIRIDKAPAMTLADHIESTLFRARELAAVIVALPTVEAGVRLQELHESDPGLAALVHVELRRLNARPMEREPSPLPLPLPPVAVPLTSDLIRVGETKAGEPEPIVSKPATHGRRPSFVGGGPPKPQTHKSIPIT